MKKITAMLLLLLIVGSLLSGCGSSKARKAEDLYEAGEYEAAAKIYAELGDKEKQAQALYDAGGYEEAAEIFAAVGNKRMQAECLYEAGHYSEAREIFEEIHDYSGEMKCLIAIQKILNKIKPAR